MNLRTRVWLRVPAKTVSQTIPFVKVTSSSKRVGPGTTTYSIDAVEKVEFTVAANAEVSDYQDLAPLPVSENDTRHDLHLSLYPIKFDFIDPADVTWSQVLDPNKVVLHDQEVKIRVLIEGVELTLTQLIGMGMDEFELNTSCSRFGETGKVILPLSHAGVQRVAENGKTEIRVSLNRPALLGLDLIESEQRAVRKSSVDHVSSSSSNFDDSGAFLSGLTGLPGVYANNKSDVDLDSDPPQSKPHKTFVQSAGCEIFEAEFAGGKIRSLLMNQAEVFYFSGHGDPGNGRDGPKFNMGNQDANGADLVGYWNQGLRVAVVAGCSVVNVNNWVPYPSTYLPPLSGSYVGCFPGVCINGVGPEFILGYGSSTPTDTQGSDAIAADFTQRYALGSANPITCWRLANDNVNGRNATAIQKDVKYGYFEKTEVLGAPVMYSWNEVPKSGW